MIRRSALESAVARGLARSRAVVLVGPRQAGKTTLARRFVSPDAEEAGDQKPIQALKLNIGNGEIKILGPKSHINWKSGIYTDEDGVQRQLTIKQLESLR